MSKETASKAEKSLNKENARSEVLYEYNSMNVLRKSKFIFNDCIYVLL